MSAPRLLLKGSRPDTFDVGRDGRLYWADTKGDTITIYSLDPERPEATPKLELKRDGFPASVSHLVAGRKGFWVRTDNLAAMCRERVTWLPRDGGRPVPLGAPSCVDGPRPARGDADAVWTVSPSNSTKRRFFIGTGPASPATVEAVRGVIDPDLEAYVHSAEATFVGLENTLFRKAHGAPSEKVLTHFYGRSAFSTPDIVSVDVEGDEIFVAVRHDKRIEVQRWADGHKPDKIGGVDTTASFARVRAGQGRVALSIYESGPNEKKVLLLLDPTGTCPPHSVAPLAHALVDFDVHGHRLLVRRKDGIEVVSWTPPAR